MYLGWKNKETYLAHLSLLEDKQLYQYIKRFVTRYESLDRKQELVSILEPRIGNTINMNEIDYSELSNFIANEHR